METWLDLSMPHWLICLLATWVTINALPSNA
jgi:hypothetical protein